jgi:pSer/pThr/pTyr-binding forkhead associated (FHA) protein
MAVVKCPNPACEWTGNAPEWEFCGHCGEELKTGLKIDPVAKKIDDLHTNIPITGKDPTSSKHHQKTEKYAQAKLVITQNGRIGHEFEIKGDCTNIGRWDPEIGCFPEIDLTEDDSGSHISRQHARILIQGNQYYIEDMGSTNKTILNRTLKLMANTPQKIKNGDEIIIGKTVLKFVTV